MGAAEAIEPLSGFPVSRYGARSPSATLASGNETPVASPALLLQEALEDILQAQVTFARPRPGAVLALGSSLAGAIAVSSLSWYLVGRFLISML